MWRMKKVFQGSGEGIGNGERASEIEQVRRGMDGARDNATRRCYLQTKV